MVQPGTKVKINAYYKRIRPDSISDIIGQEGVVISQYISEYIVQVGLYRYSIPREAFDIVKTDNLVHVGFKHCPANQHNTRDIWDIHFNGQRRSVQSRELLNLLTLQHEEEMFHMLQPQKLPQDFVDALTDRQKGQEWLERHPKHAACIYNVTKRTRAMMGGAA
jgi:hypothetical protein